ncbi:hypothetical protein NHX12_030061 [Muraenolepis orangiensis]|uniref:Proline-rich protein 15 n=1 Tax=Muraenolepis orangiensis TaxID=630683 RepID=A0A9Q0E740_9TELE|nr:hypothetical protein NHX12_030061 [Muraenolepis orangiensis]
MTERAPWWKSFLVKRKSAGPKDATPTFEPDFDPFATRPEAKDPAVASSAQQSAKWEPGQEAGDGLHGDDTYDDSRMQSVFNEQTCRRNMRVSRSGRFKEKRKVRTNLPIDEQEHAKNAPWREDQR